MDIGPAADADATYCLLSFYHLRLRLRHTHIKKDGPMSTRRSTTLPTNCYCCYLLFGQIYKYTRIERSRLTFTHTYRGERTDVVDLLPHTTICLPAFMSPPPSTACFCFFFMLPCSSSISYSNSSTCMRAKHWSVPKPWMC